MGNCNNKTKSNSQFIFPLISFIKNSTYYRQLPGNQAHYLNFVLTQKVYESEIMKAVDSISIIEWVGSVLDSMNSQMIDKKFNCGVYTGVFGEVVKEVNDNNKGECNNIFGYNVFVRKDVIFWENNDIKEEKERKNGNKGVREFPFKFGFVRMGNSCIKNNNKSMLKSVNNEINIKDSNNKEVLNEDKDKNDNNNNESNVSNLEKDFIITNNNNKNDLINIHNNNDIINKQYSGNNNEHSINNIEINSKELLTPSSLSLSNHIKQEQKQLLTNKQHTKIHKNTNSNSITKQQTKPINILHKSKTTNNANLKNLQTTLQPNAPHQQEFEIDLCNIEISNLNTTPKNNQTSLNTNNNNNPISFNNNLPLHHNINNLYGEFNMTLKPNSKLKPFNIKQIRPNKPKHIPNKKSDFFSNKILSSPTTLFKIDIKDLMSNNEQHNCSKTNVNNDIYNNNINTKHKMNTETFMECLDKFLGFDKCSKIKKKNFNVCEVKHRPFNKYSYFNNKDNCGNVNNNNSQSYRFNTVSGWKGRKELSVNNSMSICGKKQSSFYQLSTGKKDGYCNKNVKKKKMKESKKKLTYEFGDDFFEDKNSKKQIVMDDINENDNNKKEDPDKDNVNISDSVQYLSACSSHHSQEDL